MPAPKYLFPVPWLWAGITWGKQGKERGKGRRKKPPQKWQKGNRAKGRKYTKCKRGNQERNLRRIYMRNGNGKPTQTNKLGTKSRKIKQHSLPLNYQLTMSVRLGKGREVKRPEWRGRALLTCANSSRPLSPKRFKNPISQWNIPTFIGGFGLNRPKEKLHEKLHAR